MAGVAAEGDEEEDGFREKRQADRKGARRTFEEFFIKTSKF